jgi:hypothetical protein
MTTTLLTIVFSAICFGLMMALAAAALSVSFRKEKLHYHAHVRIPHKVCPQCGLASYWSSLQCADGKIVEEVRQFKCGSRIRWAKYGGLDRVDGVCCKEASNNAKDTQSVIALVEKLSVSDAVKGSIIESIRRK